MKKLSLSIFLLGFLCLSAQAFGQAARFDSTAQTTTTVSATNTTVLVPLPGATVTVCSYPSNGTLPCTNKASVCPDITEVGCTSSAPNNPITADSLGNFGFWVPPGAYQYTVCAISGVCQGPYTAIVSSSRALQNIRIANEFAGSDLGAQIAAADTDLGANPGEIWAFGGGAITTQIVISSKHVLRLFAGTYTNALGERTPVIRLQDNSSLVGESSQAIVQESSNAADIDPVIVCAYNLGSICTSLAASTTNIHVSGIHFQGANPNAGTSLIDSVTLGNCAQCSVTDNWFDTIKTSHILIGGTSGSSFWADGFEISGNYFSGTTNCSVCVINGQNISIHDNYWRLHGNGAAADIDVEPNATTDRAQHIDIHDNLFDEAKAVNTVFCVTIQNGPFVNMGEIKIHDNTCSGGPFSSWGGSVDGTFKLISCFNTGPGPVNSMSDMEIYNNVCRLASSSGITMVGTNRGYIHDNVVECVGDVAVNLAGSVTNTLVERNRVLSITSPTSCNQSAKSAYVSTTVGETLTGNANNIFRDNIARNTVVIGTGSFATSSTVPDGSGHSFGVPVGLNNGTAGGLQLGGLGSGPTLQVMGAFFSPCGLATNTYFWKVRAVAANGGMGIPSNEVSQAVVNTPNGCAHLLWTKVTGAKSYNIYRSTTTNTEQLIANVADGSVSYEDPGGQTPSTTIDNNDTSTMVAGVESLPPVGIASSDLLWPDSASHCWKLINNNGTASCAAALGLVQTWTGAQTFNDGNMILAGSSSGTTTLKATAAAGSTTATLPANTGTVGELNLAQNWTALQTFNSGLAAGASGSTIADTRELVQSAHSCGTTSTCANTANGSYRMVFGTVALASATPSTVTVSGISPAFTSSSSYVCTATPTGATAAIAAGGIAISYVSGSSFTLTGPATVTTVINYTCVGN